MKKVLSVSVIFLLLFIIRSIVLSINTHVQNDNAVRRLKENLVDKTKEDKFLTEKLQYVKSNEFVEKEAREKLGLVKEGEHIVIAPPPPQNTLKDGQKDAKENWKKWWELFF